MARRTFLAQLAGLPFLSLGIVGYEGRRTEEISKDHDEKRVGT
jgi:hypothetical protein